MVKMSGVWDRTAETISDNLGAIVPIAILAYFVPISIQGSLPQTDSVTDPALALVFALMTLGCGLLGLWGTFAITAIAAPGVRREDAGTIARHRFLAGLFVWVVLFLVVLVLLLPVLLLFLAGGASMADLLSGDSTRVAQAIRFPVVVYLLLLSGFLMWALARLSLVTPVIVVEGLGLGAIRRSFVLTRGVVWAILGVSILYFLVSGVARIATLTVFGSLFRLLVGGGDNALLTHVLTSIMAAMVQSAFAVLAAVFLMYLYSARIDACAPDEKA